MIGRRLRVRGSHAGIMVGLAVFFLLVTTAWGLECGQFDYPHCKGKAHQFGGGFKPQKGFGGFGGGNCRADRTPVIFIHGNGDTATSWDAPVTGGAAKDTLPDLSVYAEFKARGYNDCELFGLSYLSAKERNAPRRNYHQPRKYDLILSFIADVMAYTGKDRVDIVAHSLGVSMTLAALSWSDESKPSLPGWKQVRKFVNIAGGIRGLDACHEAGYANALVSTCGSENLLDKYTFGFYPDTGRSLGKNRWTGDRDALSLRLAPRHQPSTLFYTLTAGASDDKHCPDDKAANTCDQGALFVAAPNLKAQLHVGHGASSDRKEKQSIGHFRARINTGRIIAEMITTDCTRLACRGNYPGPVAEP